MTQSMYLSVQRVFVLLFSRGIGAVFGLLSAFLVVIYAGKAAAGEYFLFFSVNYFIAQIYRFGGEVDILTERGGQAALLLPTVWSIKMLSVAFLGGVVGQWISPSPMLLWVIVAAFFQCNLEQIGDYLKHQGKQNVGVFLSTGLSHLLFVALLVSGVEDLYLILLASLLLSLAIAYGCLLYAMGNVTVPFSFDYRLSGSPMAFFYNMSSHMATPIFLWLAIELFGSEVGADYRVSMRVATLVYFAFQATQQLMLYRQKKQRDGGLNQLSKDMWGVLLPVSAVACLGIILLMFLGERVGVVTGYQLNFSVIWSVVFMAAGLLASSSIKLTMDRQFAVLLSGRLLSLVFVIAVSALSLFLYETAGALSHSDRVMVYGFVVVSSSFYIMQHVISMTYCRMKKARGTTEA